MVAVSAGGYGGGSSYGSGGLSGSYGGGNQGYSSGSQGYGQSAGGYGGGGVVSAAVQSRRSVQYYDVPSSQQAAAPLAIEVNSQASPLTFLFKSQSSPIQIQSQHQSSPGSYQETSSQDEPHVAVHTVTRPVIQELREIITPFRRVRQEIQPVQEDIQTFVSRDAGGQSYGGQQQSTGGYGGQSYGGKSYGGQSAGGYGGSSY